MVLVVPRTDSGRWGAGLAYGAAVLVLALLQPPRLLADLPVGRVLAAAVLGAATAAVIRRRRTGHIVVPALVGLIALAIAFDLGAVAMLLLFELLFVGTLDARGRWRWIAWGFAGVVNIATVLAAMHQATEPEHVAVLALQNLTLSVIAVWWAQNLKMMRERTEREHARKVAQELAARREREASEARSELAVSAERVRLARDMHDLVAGRLAAISMQSAVALRAEAPEQVRKAIADIKACSDATLGEVRTMIDELGSQTRTTSNLADCRRRLLDTVRTARSLGVELVVREDPDALACPSGVTLYVIAQEVVSNMITHAGPCEATLELRGDETSAVLRAWNSIGCSPDDAELLTGHGGWGLANIADRVAPFGGHIECGLTGGGTGWQVDVVIPRRRRRAGDRAGRWAEGSGLDEGMSARVEIGTEA